MPTARDWEDGELHEAKIAVNAVALAAGKVVSLPDLELELVAISATALCSVCHLPSQSQVAVLEAPDVR